MEEEVIRIMNLRSGNSVRKCSYSYKALMCRINWRRKIIHNLKVKLDKICMETEQHKTNTNSIW